MKAFLFVSLGVLGLSVSAFSHEAFETVANCLSSDLPENYSLKVMDSTSSSRAVLEIEKILDPSQEPAEVLRLYGVKDDTVRDPIVLQYEFEGFELMISLERRNDGSYPAILTMINSNGDRKYESFSCKL